VLFGFCDLLFDTVERADDPGKRVDGFDDSSEGSLYHIGDDL